VVDPRPYVKGKIKETFKKYPNIGNLLPAMGYGDQQVLDLERTINAVPCDAVIIGTPIDLRRIIRIVHPTVRVRYELEEMKKPGLKPFVEAFIKHKGRKKIL
jgi:predicted GTPase